MNASAGWKCIKSLLNIHLRPWSHLLLFPSNTAHWPNQNTLKPLTDSTKFVVTATTTVLTRLTHLLAATSVRGGPANPAVFSSRCCYCSLEAHQRQLQQHVGQTNTVGARMQTEDDLETRFADGIP